VRAVLKNIRPERLAHFFIFGILGGLIALAEGSKINWTVLDFITIAVAVFTIAFAWIFAVVVNDIVDEHIDAISNADRPLITGALSLEMMKNVAFVSGVMMFAGALALGSYATFWILLFSVSYYIYSAPPLRLKRVPILSSAFIGVSTLAIMMLGFFLISANQALAAFPTPIALLVILFMTTITNVRDLKDIKGDAAAGIWTLPTLLGDRRSRVVIGAMVFIAYALVPLLIPIPILWAPSLIAGGASWAGLVRGMGERFVFPLYFLYLISVVSLLSFI
jgi:4-hydroxybenzoate polyprenyltransferase